MHIQPTKIQTSESFLVPQGQLMVSLDSTAKLLAKLLSGSKDPDAEALSETVGAKYGITEPLAKPAMVSPSPGLTSLADDFKRARASRLLPEVTCPSPLHPRPRRVAIAEVQDEPVTEPETRGPTASAPLPGKPPTPSECNLWGWEERQTSSPNEHSLELREFDPKDLPEWAEEFAEFVLLTGKSHWDVTTKCSLLKRSCKKKYLQKQVKQIVNICSTWAEILQGLEKTLPVYETDLSVSTQIEELPMLPEFPPAARISEYVCDPKYLLSRMSCYGPTERHLWLVGKIPPRTWEVCRSTSERKRGTHT